MIIKFLLIRQINKKKYYHSNFIDYIFSFGLYNNCLNFHNFHSRLSIFFYLTNNAEINLANIFFQRSPIQQQKLFVILVNYFEILCKNKNNS